MNKIICNSLEFVFSHEIRVITPETVFLKEGCTWNFIRTIEKPVYQMQIKEASAGPLREETLQAVTWYNSESLLKAYSSYPVVLRLKTNESVFFMGSDHFPVVVTISSDKIKDIFSFSSKSIP